MHPCLIIVASICLPWAPGKAEIVNSSIARSVHVTSADGRVDVEYESDNIMTGAWTSAAKTCSAGGCVEYRRTGSGDGRRVQTDFLIRRAVCLRALRVVVSSKSAAAQARLLAEVSVIPPHASAAGAIPLSRLDVQTGGIPYEERMAVQPEGPACSD